MFPLRLAELHPIVVHFPIALLITSVALDFAGCFLHRAGLTTAATWCLLLGVPGAYAALFSGFLSERDVALAMAGSMLHLHKVCAVLTTFSFSLLLLVRLIWLLPTLYVKSLPPLVVALYLLASVVSVVLLGLTGYLGGAMVYDRGVGQPLP